MSEQAKGFMVSAVVHITVLLLICASVPERSTAGRSVHMDFSIVESAKSGAAAKEPVIRKREKERARPHQKQIEQGPPFKEDPALEPQEPDETVEEAASGKAVAGSAEHGAKGRDFSYIKALLQKNLKYPPIARRNGWEGKVVVTFVIACDGSVRDIEVVETSGKALFDRNAVEVVLKSVPFPENDTETRILIPIVYSLSEGRV